MSETKVFIMNISIFLIKSYMMLPMSVSYFSTVRCLMLYTKKIKFLIKLQYSENVICKLHEQMNKNISSELGIVYGQMSCVV